MNNTPNEHNCVQYNYSSIFLKNTLSLLAYCIVMVICFFSLVQHAKADNTFGTQCKQRGGTYTCTTSGLKQEGKFEWMNGPSPSGFSISEVYGLRIDGLNISAQNSYDCVNRGDCFEYKARPDACSSPVATSYYSSTYKRRILSFGVGGGRAGSNPCSYDIYRNGNLFNEGACYNCWIQVDIVCPAGWNAQASDTPNGLPGFCYRQTPPKENGGPECDGAGNNQQPSTGHPIILSTGNKHKRETDYQTSNVLPFKLSRQYNSLGALSSKIDFGNNWTFEYDRNLYVELDGSVQVNRQNGKTFFYQLDSQSDLYTTDADINHQLTELKDENQNRVGWLLINAKDNSSESYNLAGQLLAIEQTSGLSLNFYYDLSVAEGGDGDSQTLDVITDALGRSSYIKLIATEPESADINKYRFNQYTDFSGGLYQFSYDQDGNLTSVQNPDNTNRTYHYEDTEYKTALTGITDENDNRYLTWVYGSSNSLTPGQGVSGELAGGADKETISLNASRNNGIFTATVTDARGTQRDYKFQTVVGIKRVIEQSQPAGAGCAASGSNITYDVNGNVSTKMDFNGNLTQYHYDMSRNLETTRVEGLDTAGNVQIETRTVTTSWHPDWRLPEVISEYSGGADSSGNPQGTLLRQTTTVYDDKGNITSISINDPINNRVRTTTTTYTYSVDVPGLILTKEVDGPRTDVSDITTYDYYPHDATCVDSTATPLVDPITNTSPENYGCRGQLQTMTNALGHQTTYDRYNHHGQLEQMTDPNGLVTEYTYDLRQRMTSTTKGTELTNYQYDAVGQLDILTLPDGTQLDYDYDAAHRLTDIRDNQGNHIHYNLDSMGNREQEDTYDPQGALTKTISRGYDALNRLQQVTGVE